MIRLSVLFSILTVLFGCTGPAPERTDFSLHLFVEPQHLDPALLRGSSSSYFFHNTMRGLYRFDTQEGLTPEGGQCRWKSPTQLHCDLKESLWSDGSPVQARHYVHSFRHLIDPNTASPRSSLLRRLQNAIEIQKGQKPPSSLGVKALSDKQLEFSFAKRDPDFLYKLTSTALLPKHPLNKKNKKSYKSYLFNGPYQIASWNFGKVIVLKPNPYYKLGHPKRPRIRFLMI
ncbi:MAG: ABC transporter substrate-binding protein, partial [Pseudomonadota bacterium]